MQPSDRGTKGSGYSSGKLQKKSCDNPLSKSTSHREADPVTTVYRTGYTGSTNDRRVSDWDGFKGNLIQDRINNKYGVPPTFPKGSAKTSTRSPGRQKYVSGETAAAPSVRKTGRLEQALYEVLTKKQRQK